MIFTYSNLATWVNEDAKLRSITRGKEFHDDTHCSYRHPCIFNLGFLRVVHIKSKVFDPFEDSNFLRGKQLHETPDFDPFCLGGYPYVVVKTVPHQAMWLMSREEILHLNDTCQFFELPTRMYINPGFIREYWSSYSIFRNMKYVHPPLNCMVTKLIPAAKIELFTVEHYQRNDKNVSNRPSLASFLVEKSIIAGKLHNNGKTNTDFPDCWPQASEDLGRPSVLELEYRHFKIRRRAKRQGHDHFSIFIKILY